MPWQLLAAETGAKIRVAPVDDAGRCCSTSTRSCSNPRTRLVSLAHVSNALGTITPAAEMVAMAHRHGARVLVDGAQAVSHMRVDVQAIDCDFYVFSGHKIFAPTGIGVVYGKPEVLEQMPPWQGGGNMIVDVTFEKTVYQAPPGRFEAGTGSIADAVGLGAALDYLQQLRHGDHRTLRARPDGLRHGRAAPGARPATDRHGAAKRPACCRSCIDGKRTEDIGAALDKEGIAVRVGPSLRAARAATVRPRDVPCVRRWRCTTPATTSTR